MLRNTSIKRLIATPLDALGGFGVNLVILKQNEETKRTDSKLTLHAVGFLKLRARPDLSWAAGIE